MNEMVFDLGQKVLRCEKVIKNEWQQLSLVYDVSVGHQANSGFLYNQEKVRPFSARISGAPLELDDNVVAFQKAVEQKFGKKFKQLLIQTEKETGRIKIDFEFDDPSRWSIGPGNLKEMRESLRPKFD